MDVNDYNDGKKGADNKEGVVKENMDEKDYKDDEEDDDDKRR